MPIRKVAGQVTIVRDGMRAVVPAHTPFNFTKEELDSVMAADPNLVRTPSDAEVKGASKFEELKGARPLTRPAVPVNTKAAEQAPAGQDSVNPTAGGSATDGVEKAHVYSDDELEQMTVKQLKELAEKRKLEVPSNANKPDLKTLILDDQASAEDL